MDSVKMVVGQLVPRPLRDAGEALYTVKTDPKSSPGVKQFVMTTIERLLLAGLAAGAARLVPAPKWAVYGATAVVSLPAAVALGASELAYCGLKCISRDPCLLAGSALSLGASWLLFENYDRIHLNKKGYSQLHLKPEFELEERGSAWGSQIDAMLNKKATWFSPKFWGMGLGEPALVKLNLWLFPKS